MSCMLKVKELSDAGINAFPRGVMVRERYVKSMLGAKKASESLE